MHNDTASKLYKTRKNFNQQHKGKIKEPPIRTREHLI